MLKHKQTPTTKRPSEKGQGLVEYALILVLVAVVSIGILTVFGPAIGNVFSNVNTELINAGGGGDVAEVSAPEPEPEPEITYCQTIFYANASDANAGIISWNVWRVVDGTRNSSPEYSSRGTDPNLPSC